MYSNNIILVENKSVLIAIIGIFIIGNLFNRVMITLNRSVYFALGVVALAVSLLVVVQIAYTQSLPTLYHNKIVLMLVLFGAVVTVSSIGNGLLMKPIFLNRLFYLAASVILGLVLLIYWEYDPISIVFISVTLLGSIGSVTILVDYLSLFDFTLIHTKSGYWNRYTGIFGEPNFAGGLLATTVPFLGYYVRKTDNLIHFTVNIIAIFLIFVSIYLTGSRMSIIMVSVGVFLMVLYEVSSRYSVWAAVLVSATLTVSFIMIMYFLLHDRLQYLLSFILGTGGDGSIESRYLILLSGIEMALDNPILGVGLGNFNNEIINYSSELAGKSAHNVFIAYFAEIGMVGGLIFTILLFYLSFSFFHIGFHGKNPRIFYIFIASIVVFVQLLFLSDFNNRFLWFILLPIAIALKFQLEDPEIPLRS